MSESTSGHADWRRRLLMLVLAIAVVGLATVGWHEFGLEEPVRILGFLGVSTLSSIVHGVLGVVLTTAGLHQGATGTAPIAVVVFVAMAVFGAVALIFGGSGDPLNVNWWNVLLYVLSAGACGYVYISAFARARTR